MLWIYPARKNVKITTTSDTSLTSYIMNRGNDHKFCSTCGMNVVNVLPEGEKLPVNARLLKGIDLKDMNRQTYDGFNLLKPAARARVKSWAS